MYLRAANGFTGEITAPSVGATIGTIHKWSITRIENKYRDGLGIYRFFAAFSYFNPYLYGEDAIRKEIKVRIGRNGKWYRIDPEESALVQISGSEAINISEVTVWPVGDD
jgi:hypothetical protein